MAALSIFSKMHFIWLTFCNFTKITYLLLLMSVECTIVNKAVANSGCMNVCCTLNFPLKMLPPHFRYFHCFIFKMNFDKNLMKKLPFLTSFKFRLFRKISCFSNRCQFNDYRKYSLNNSQNLQTFFAFAVSRRYANWCFKISNPS